MSKPHHSIKVAAQRSGLTPHAIRVWEKRYRAVTPHRTDTDRRVYSDSEIERLSLLRDAIQSGHSIGHIATLPNDRLRKIISQNQSKPPRVEPTSPGELFLQQCLQAVHSLDARALENYLRTAETELGSQGLLQRVVAPLVQKIGELWRDGTITAAHEHFATAVIRVFLGHAARQFAGSPEAPVFLVVTPLGQLHELGALLAALAAANLGWNVTYLGASLPAPEIAGAARHARASAVGLSLVYPEDDPRLDGELEQLRQLLPPDVSIVVGGRAAPAYHNILKKIGAHEAKDLTELCATLDQIRRRRPTH